jgi:hypothetical protein
MSTSRPSQRERRTEVRVVNRLFNTTPVIVHAHGCLLRNPAWPAIKATVFAGRSVQTGPIRDLSVMTCNNGSTGMGLFEQSASARDIPCAVWGHGITPWINSRDKLRAIYAGLLGMESEYVLYADSRDAVVVGDLEFAVQHFEMKKGCDLLFGADRMNWPALPAFRNYEASLPDGKTSQFRYLNGGTWIGRVAFCREFFEQALVTDPVPQAPESEQGILKTLFPRFHPRVQLDYRCEIFQNLGYVFNNTVEVAIVEM